MPRLIPPRFVPKIWGTRDLRRWFPDRGLEPVPIGEVWLSSPDAPVLVKMLFPEETLSVQVHPDDTYAQAHGWATGKNEAWYVLEAGPDAALGLGLKAGVDRVELEAACRTGRSRELLEWLTVRAGDVVNVPAGTVHAIGPGMVLFEVQQPTDVTFRLDDYGRGRELHLEHGMNVVRPTRAGNVCAAEDGTLLSTPHFHVRRHHVEPGTVLAGAKRTRWLFDTGRNSAWNGWPAGHMLELGPDDAWTSDRKATLLEVMDPVAAAAAPA